MLSLHHTQNTGIEPFFPVRIYVTIFKEESNLNNPIKACCHYTRKVVVPEGVEPTHTESKSAALPLRYGTIKSGAEEI